MTLTPLAQFGDTALLVLLLAAAAAGAVAIGILRWRAKQVARLLGRGGGHVLIGAAPGRSLWKFGLISAVVLLLAIAIARPQIGERTRDLTQRGVALVVALDASLSMAAEDAIPNRMQAAQSELGGLLERMSGDRVGLVIFAGEARVRFPLTRDLETARALIDAVLPGERLLPPGTDVGAAIEQSLGLLRDSDARTKVILLVGDGESLSGDALAAASAAAGVGVRIFSAGVGSEAGATIPVLNSATRAIVPKIDAASGRPVTTRLDSQALITLARRGDGRFLRLDRPGALSYLAGDLNALEASRFQVSTTRRPIERFQIPLAVALALLLMEPLIAARAPATNAAGTPERRPRQRPRLRRRWLFAGLLPIVAIVAAACGNLAADRNTSGNRAYAEGRFADAATAYSEALAERPDDPRLALNLGRALHALGQYDAAVSATQRALAQSAADSALSARAYFNLGNHRVQQADLIAARSAYIEALLRDPADADAKINLEIVNAASTPAPAPSPDPGSPSSSPSSSSDASGAAGRDAQAAPGNTAGGGGNGDAGDVDPAPSGTTPGGSAGRAPTPGTDDAQGVSAREAAAELETALDALNGDNPTTEQALAILDALRLRNQPGGPGSGLLGIDVAGTDDY